jgi:hypothetical protein
MKIAICFLFALAVCNACGGDSLETKREIRDRNDNGNPERIVDSVFDGTNLVRRTITADTNDDGTPDQRIISCYRHGEKASVFWRHMDQSNRTTRIFMSEGRQVVMNDDEHGDGHFETMMIFDTNGIPRAVFTIDSAGVPSPVSDDRLQEFVEGFSFGNEVVKPILETIAESGKQESSEQHGGQISSEGAPPNESSP